MRRFGGVCVCAFRGALAMYSVFLLVTPRSVAMIATHVTRKQWARIVRGNLGEIFIPWPIGKSLPRHWRLVPIPDASEWKVADYDDHANVLAPRCNRYVANSFNGLCISLADLEDKLK